MTDTPPNYRTNIQSYFRSPFAPRIHFDEAGAGAAGAGAGNGGAASGAGTGGAAEPWFKGVDAETLGHWDNKGWKYQESPKDLATELTKAWKAAEKHIGAPADRIVRLPEKADDEAGWSAVRQRLGMPKEAKEYDFSTVKFGDGTELDQAFTDTMRGALHKAGVAKDAAPEIARAVVNFMDAADKAETTERAAKLQAERAALDREWGTNKDINSLTAMQGAKRAVGGNQESAEAVISAMESAIGYKATMEFWRKIGAGTTDDTFIEGGSGGNPVTMNGAIARRAELEKDPDFSARYLKGDPKAVAEMNALIELIAGSAA